MTSPREFMIVLAVVSVCAHALGAQEPSSRGLVVRGLSFEGNHAIDDGVLRISIATSQSAVFARSPFLRWMGLGERRFLNETELRRDVLRIAAFYRQSGFVDATVDTLVRRTETDAYIRFVIYEGEPIRVEDIQIEGVAALLDTGRLRAALPLRRGDPFNRLLMLASADTISLRLADNGYPFTEIFRNFDTDLRTRRANIRFEVYPGSRARVADIRVIGIEDINESVVRKRLAIQPGDVFSQRDLYRSQLDLYRTQLFDYVNLGVVGRDREAVDEEPVDIEVRVSEGPRHRVRLGAGYGTVDCFRALGSWTVYNFLGGGRSFELKARTSQVGAGAPTDFGFENSVCPQLAEEDTSRVKLNYNLTAGLYEPFFLSRTTSASFELFAERFTEYQAYLRQSVGGDVGLTFRVDPTLPITLSYRLSYGSTKADPAIFCTFLNVCRLQDTEVFTQDLLRATLSLALLRDRRNSVLNPTRGSWLASEVRVAAPAIGSDTLVQFTKGTVEFASYRPIGRRSTLSVRVKLGTIIPSEVGFEAQPLQYVPTEERFYAGGANTVRGYGQNELGPVVRVIDTVITKEEQQDGQLVTVADSVIRTSATGGTDVIIANAELRFPLPGFSEKVSGAVFVDAGRIFARGSEVASAPGLRVTPGVGVRVTSPLGPVRLDLAFNPYPVDKSRLYRKSNGELVLVRDANNEPLDYEPPRSFLGRFRLHFSVGQAF
jgi:outer membrane protein assembly factor BamA